MNMKYENFIYSTLEFAHFCPKKGYEIGGGAQKMIVLVHADRVWKLYMQGKGGRSKNSKILNDHLLFFFLKE